MTIGRHRMSWPNGVAYSCREKHCMASSVFAKEKQNEVTGPLHRPVCLQLKAHQAVMAAVHMRDMFATDPARFERFSLQAGELLLDYSKNRITDETMGLLGKLAEEADVTGWRDRMLSGAKNNNTAHRADLHQ